MKQHRLITSLNWCYRIKMIESSTLHIIRRPIAFFNDHLQCALCIACAIMQWIAILHSYTAHNVQPQSTFETLNIGVLQTRESLKIIALVDIWKKVLKLSYIFWTCHAKIMLFHHSLMFFSYHCQKIQYRLLIDVIIFNIYFSDVSKEFF